MQIQWYNVREWEWDGRVEKEDHWMQQSCFQVKEASVDIKVNRHI